MFSPQDQEKIKNAIISAEKNTSGEIKVHIESYCKTNPMQRATQLFNQLELYRTAARNGVLIYLAYKDHKFAILGDEGIHTVVGQDFWDTTKDVMISYFKNGEYVQGLCEGIEKAGQQLKTNFPYQSNDKNELSDDISFGEDYNA
jgi:uncharacterized membrane protein